jgi:hypothetical protein
VSDIDTAMVDSLKVLDPNRPIREAEVTALALFAPVGVLSPMIYLRRLGAARIAAVLRGEFTVQ